MVFGEHSKGWAYYSIDKSYLFYAIESVSLHFTSIVIVFVGQQNGRLGGCHLKCDSTGRVSVEGSHFEQAIHSPLTMQYTHLVLVPHFPLFVELWWLAIFLS